MQEALKQEYLANYVNEFGLGKLEQDKEINDNGILFHAFAMWLFSKFGLVDNKDLNRDFLAICGIQASTPGLFKRFPTDVRSEAHDNYVGICVLSLLHGFGFPRDIVQYGTEKGFVYNNLSPDTWDIKFMRQGGDIAFYKICAGYVPTLWELAWMCGGILTSVFLSGPSQTNLSWLRLEAVNYAIAKKLPIYRIHWMCLLIGFTKLVFDVKLKLRYGGIAGSFANYYKPEHPINKLARLLK